MSTVKMFPTQGIGESLQQRDSSERDLASELLLAADVSSVADAIVTAARRRPSRREATVIWSLAWPGERHTCPQAALSSERLVLADRTIAAASDSAHSIDGRDMAMVLCRQDDGAAAVLVLRLADGAAPLFQDPLFQGQFELAQARMSAALELASMRDVVTRIEQAQKLQRALFAIADMPGSKLDMGDMLRGVACTVSAAA